MKAMSALEQQIARSGLENSLIELVAAPIAFVYTPLTHAKRVKDHFTPAEMVDLTPLVNTITSWNRFAIAFRKLFGDAVWREFMGVTVGEYRNEYLLFMQALCVSTC